MSRCTPVDPANLQSGDKVKMPKRATLYVEDGMLLNADEATEAVTHTPMGVVGVSLSVVRLLYGGQSQGGATQPLNDVSEQVEPDLLTTEAIEVADPIATEVIDPRATEAVESMITEAIEAN